MREYARAELTLARQMAAYLTGGADAVRALAPAGAADIYGQCVACSGELKPIEGADWACMCEDCGGVHATERAIPMIVNVNAPMLADAAAEDMRYFDITRTDGRRIHGWFDFATRRVVQYG